jgi:hypothetical protein
MVGASVLAVTLIGISCYPGSVSNVSELDTVVTFSTPDTTFYQKFSTYVLVDTVIEFAPNDSICPPGINLGDCLDPVYDHSKDALILATYRSEIEKAGYVAPTGADTSAVFLVGVTARSDTSIWVSWPVWPGWGYPGYGPGWGWGWYWPPTGGISVTDQGSLVMIMVDPDGPIGGLPTDSIVQGAWAGVVRAVLSNSGISDARVQSGIVQAWTQSPYLRRVP